MEKLLVIVESPAKAKTINQYLGKNYIVTSSIGHIRDLPTSRSITRKTKKNKNLVKSDCTKKKYSDFLNNIGIDPYHSWKANYIILPGKEKIVSDLKNLASKAKHIFLATDLDREGEAIAWHLKEVIGGNNSRYSRVIFNEITEHSIHQAFSNLSELNMNKVYAQQARRFMDRIVGYTISPLLWKKISRGLSAGRVQSVAVRIIIEREREIKIFLPKKYWKINAILSTKEKQEFLTKVTHINNKKLSIQSQVELKKIVNNINKMRCIVHEIKKNKILTRPKPPFITSTLQQSANIMLGFGVKKTMLLAQKLYESGYISYIRTDSTNLSKHALKMVRTYIKDFYGNDYLPKTPNYFPNKSHSQEAHEAIRPTNINLNSKILKNTEKDGKKLYDLIWTKFVACQMNPSEYESNIMVIKNSFFISKYKEKILLFQGWTKLIPLKYDFHPISSLKNIGIGTILYVKKVIPTQLFTIPPKRFTECSLVKELEKRNIGRPSTYSSIISTIQQRGYVRIENKKFYAEKIGEIITDRLKENFSDLMDYNFTANMENKLDLIAENKIEWHSVLNKFFNNFISKLKQAEKSQEEGGMKQNIMVLTSIKCSICNQNMGIRTAITGVFLGCSGYNHIVKKKRCKKTVNLIPENEFLNIIQKNYNEENYSNEIYALRLKQRCCICNTAMDSYFIDKLHKIHICGNNPICIGYKLEKSPFNNQKYISHTIKCEKCNLEMELKKGPFGKFLICTNKICKNTRKILKNGEVDSPRLRPIPLPDLLCQYSNASFVLREGISGIFLAANTFPNSRETRTPYVEELLRFKSLLPKKIRYLADAPIQDDEGNKTVVLFNRKTKEQYVSSEQKDKRKKWVAFFINGKWSIINSKNKKS